MHEHDAPRSLAGGLYHGRYVLEQGSRIPRRPVRVSGIKIPINLYRVVCHYRFDESQVRRTAPLIGLTTRSAEAREVRRRADRKRTYRTLDTRYMRIDARRAGAAHDPVSRTGSRS